MPAGVVVDGGAESSYEDALSHPPTEPIVVSGDCGKIRFSNVVGLITRVLHNRGLELARSTDGGGKMLVDPGLERPPRLAYVLAVTW